MKGAPVVKAYGGKLCYLFSLFCHFSSKQTYLQKACNSLEDKIFSFLARAPKIGSLGDIVHERLRGLEGTEQGSLKSYITSWTYSWSAQVREWSRTTEQRLLEWKYSTDGHSSAIWLAPEDWIEWTRIALKGVIIKTMIGTADYRRWIWTASCDINCQMKKITHSSEDFNKTQRHNLQNFQDTIQKYST